MSMNTDSSPYSLLMFSPLGRSDTFDFLYALVMSLFMITIIEYDCFAELCKTNFLRIRTN